MIFYQLDYVVDEVLKDLPTEEQIFLRKYLNRSFSREEAKFLWAKIVDHKWLVGERLKRDVGFRVAAVDYLENFYEPASAFGNKNRRSGIFSKIFHPINASLRNYFVSKSRILPQ